MKTLAFILSIVLFAFVAHAQVLTLEKDQQLKTIEAGSYLRIHIEGGSNGDLPDCWNYDYYGRLKAVSNDSLVLEVFEKELLRASEHMRRETRQQYFNEDDFVEQKSFYIPDINYLKRGKSLKAVKGNQDRGGIAALFFILGGGTMLASILLNKEEGRSKIFTLGAAEMGIGIVLGLSTSRPAFHLNNPDSKENWRVKKK
jgi:hypothetical protein